MFGIEIYQPEGLESWWIASTDNVIRWETNLCDGYSEYYLIGRVK